MKAASFLAFALLLPCAALAVPEGAAPPPIDQALYLQQADAALREGRLTQAGQMIAWLDDRAHDISGDDVALLKAEYAIAINDVGRAAKALANVTDGERNICRLHTAKGWLSANMLQLDESIVALAKANHECPHDAGIWNLLGLVLMRKGEGEAALEAFGEAHHLAPGNAGILNNMALALLQKGEREFALRQLDAARAMAPGNRMVEANRDFVAGTLGHVPQRSLLDSDAAWSARLVSFAQGAKAATRKDEADALFSRALLTMDRFDQAIWSEIAADEDRP